MSKHVEFVEICDINDVFDRIRFCDLSAAYSRNFVREGAVQFTLGRCDFYRGFLKDKISHYAVFVYVCDAFVAAVGNADSFVGYAQIAGVVKVKSVAAVIVIDVVLESAVLSLERV